VDKKLSETIIHAIEKEKPESLKQLVTIVKQRSSASEQKIIQHVLQLESEGKISLQKPPKPPPQKLTDYLRTGEAYWYWITIILAISTTATALTVPETAYPYVYLRYALGMIFVLWLPGFSLVKALFPKEPPIKTPSRNIDTIEQVALSIGLSLALVPIVGLLLNYTSWGIRLTPIVLSLLALTTVFATVGIAREHQARIEKQPG
jgi:hypothetical protein